MKNRKYVFIGMLVLAGIATGCGKNDNDSNLPVIGTWKYAISQPDLSFEYILKVEKSQVTLTNNCNVLNQKGSVSVSSSATVDEKSITINEYKSAKSGPCSINIEKNQLIYSISDNKLTLKDPSVESDDPVVYTRQ